MECSIYILYKYYLKTTDDILKWILALYTQMLCQYQVYEIALNAMTILLMYVCCI